jgi:hypothetical protein
MTLTELKRDMDDGVTSQSTALAADQQGRADGGGDAAVEQQIEDAFGDAAAVLPRRFGCAAARRAVYQRDMLVALAQKHKTIDEIVARELEDVACAHALELAAVVSTFDVGLWWPDGDTFCTN